MPRSKRNRVVPLTTTKKKGKTGKSELIENIQQCITKYSSIYVIQPHNRRNDRLQELRTTFRTSRTKLLFVPLHLRTLKKDFLTLTNFATYDSALIFLTSQCFVGQCGLLFTNEPKDKIISFFRSHTAEDYPKTGFTATRDVTIPAGILQHFPASMEMRFRALGLPTKLTNGQIELLGDFTVCREGEVLSPEQARILTLLEDKMATFRVELMCCWTPTSFEKFSEE